MKRIAGLLLALGLVLTPAAAQGHAQLVSSWPKPNQQISTNLTGVRLTFSDQLMNISETSNLLYLSRVGGARLVTTAPSLLGNQLSIKLPGKLALGKYRVSYRVISEDGHPISGNYTFSVVKR
ncbi:MAG: hypothetical protein RIR16_1050 [Actinomycetota bacterium]|jgi:methionine-rich copper-binding protein CopC